MFGGITAEAVAAAIIVALMAGVVKGAVGFAMPMIMVSALGSFLPAETAVAALILPTVLANAMQALRQGWGVAWAVLRAYARLILVLTITILLAAQLLPILPQNLFFLLLGGPILAYALAELAGRRLRLPARRSAAMDWTVGLISGFFGGISGSWGPLIVAWLVALRVNKDENMRAQGVIYLVAGAALFVGHLKSGVLNAQSAPLSLLLVLPAGLGMWAGFAVHDRLNPEVFRRWTLLVLALAGANLLRRGLMG